MPVIDAVQTFTGIANENEFYSHHYLAEVFKGDIKARLDAWAQEEEADASRRTPFKQLAALFGAVGGPLAFLAGERLGAITLLPPLRFGLLRLSVSWAIALLVFSVVVRRSAPESDAPCYRTIR